MQGKCYTIFYADDDADDREFFQEVIADIDGGHNIFTQSSGDELLDTLHSPPPQANIVFLDLNMPIKNGYEVLKEIRMSPTAHKLPVIILSTSNDEKAIDTARQLGASLYISKPGSYSEFKKLIQSAISRDWEHYQPSREEFFHTVN